MWVFQGKESKLTRSIGTWVISPKFAGGVLLWPCVSLKLYMPTNVGVIKLELATHVWNTYYYIRGSPFVHECRTDNKDAGGDDNLLLNSGVRHETYPHVDQLSQAKLSTP